MAGRGTSHDSSSPCVKRSCVKGETERAAVHQTTSSQTHPRDGTPTGRQGTSRLKLMVLALVFCLAVQSVSAGSHEYGCKEGRKHKRFTACECGQYGHIIGDDEAQDLEDNGEIVHRLNRGRTPKYYICSQCSKCGDGMLVLEKCTQHSDTVCSPDKCADPTWKFDFGLKACKPTPTRAPPTTPTWAPAITWPVLALGKTPSARAGTDAAGVPDENADAPAFGTRSWLEKHITNIILGVVVGLALVMVCICAMLVMMLKMHRQIAALKPAPSPYSSHNTSQSTIADV